MNAVSFLEKKIKALLLDDYEIYGMERRHLTAEARDGEIDSLDEAVERGVAVRLFRGGKCGFACASDGPDPFLYVALLQRSFVAVAGSIEANRRKSHTQLAEGVGECREGLSHDFSSCCL